MTLGERLMNLRKEKHLSQEEVADRLNVTRQTVSKWELDQSTPDFDKIVPLCKLYEISSEELITGNKPENTALSDDEVHKEHEKFKKEKRTKGLVNGIFLYFVSIVWIMITIPVLNMNPVLASGMMLLIMGVATCMIVYTQIMYKKTKTKKEEKESKLYKQLEDIIAIFTLIVYLVVSFATMAWYITWVLWLVYALVMAIVKLLISLRGDKND